MSFWSGLHPVPNSEPSLRTTEKKLKSRSRPGSATADAWRKWEENPWKWGRDAPLSRIQAQCLEKKRMGISSQNTDVPSLNFYLGHTTIFPKNRPHGLALCNSSKLCLGRIPEVENFSRSWSLGPGLVYSYSRGGQPRRRPSFAPLAYASQMSHSLTSRSKGRLLSSCGKGCTFAVRKF